MERLRQRIATARQALAQLGELTAKAHLTEIERDAAIQRFEYSFETTWKAAQLFLRVVEGTEVGSPKAAARASLQVALLSEDEVREALAMTDDRNLTSHTYDAHLAAEIAARLPKHQALLSVWIDRIAKRSDI